MLLAHESKHENLYIPGLGRDGSPITHVAVPGFWQHHQSDQRRGGPGELYLAELFPIARQHSRKGPVGIVTVTLRDGRGRIKSRDIVQNVLTDLGANAMLQAGLTAAGRYLCMDTSVAAAQLGAAASGTITTLTVVGTSGGTASGGNPTFQTANAASTFQSNSSDTGIKQNNNAPGVIGTFPAGLDTTYGTGIQVSFGTAQAEGVAGSTTSNTTTNINVTSYTVTKTHSINDWVLAMGSTADNPTTAPTGPVYSTVLTPTPSGTGIGNRAQLFTYTFSSITVGTYTGGWLLTATSWASGIALARFSMTPKYVGSSDSVTINYSVKL